MLVLDFVQNHSFEHLLSFYMMFVDAVFVVVVAVDPSYCSIIIIISRLTGTIVPVACVVVANTTKSSSSCSRIRRRLLLLLLFLILGSGLRCFCFGVEVKR